jgi:PAS domain S-box-containing protein
MILSNRLKKWWPSTVRFQLMLGIAFILALLMSMLVLQQVNSQKHFLLKQNHDRAIGLSANLANTASSYLVSYELAGLQKLAISYKNIPDILYSFVTAEDGTVLGHTDEKYIGLKATDSISRRLKPENKTQILLENNSVLDVATPILNQGEIIGWARIGLSQEYIRSNVRDIERRGILYILISLIIGSVFAIIVANRLSKGLQKLLTAATKIREGNRELRVGISNSIEITQLGTAFNQMLDDISSNEKLLEMVLENMPVGVWILDEKGKILSVNSAGKEMWKGIKYVGADEYNMYKAWFTETGKEVQNNEWGASLVLADQRPVFNQEIEIECFDKSRKIILNSAIPLLDPNEKIVGVITINVDITERKLAELERERTMTELLQRNRDLEQFSYIVSHNLRGPVASIMGLSGILQGLQLNAREKDQLISGMGSSAQNLDMVIQDLNTILKVKSDMSENKALIHFSELIKEIEMSLKNLITSEKVKIVCDFTATDEITTVKSYLYSIFYNLITNSIKYRQPEADPVIEISSEITENKTILHFKDNGLGIDLLKNGKDVFGLYKRFHFHIEGKGMGLFMVKTQVEALRGHISIQSHENGGTEFKIEFEN